MTCVTTIRLTLVRLVALLAASGLVGIAAAGPAQAAPTPPPNLPAQVDAFAAYVPASTCSQTVKPGTRALMDLLLDNYPGTTSLGIVIDCYGGVRSEHKEGRALDWANRAWVPSEAANVRDFTRWVLAADRYGNSAAMARRLGIMYMIWDDQIWESYRAADGWQPYRFPGCPTVTQCSQSLRHRDHVHISLSWSGALGHTSYWAGRLDTAGYVVKPAVRISSVDHTVLSEGVQRSAVAVLQRGLRMPVVTGYYGPLTRRAVLSYQSSRGLPTTGVVAELTWGRLQRELAIDAQRIVGVDHTFLSVGSTGWAVRVMESALNRPVNGWFSTTDRDAVRTFQALHRIPTTGAVGPLTWVALRGV